MFFYNGLLAVLGLISLLSFCLGWLTSPKAKRHRKIGLFRSVGLYFKNFLNFRGRSSRGAYFWSVIVVASIQSFISLILVSAMPSLMIYAFLQPQPLYLVFNAILNFILFYPILVRRLHDLNMSGWHVLWVNTLVALPVIAFFLARAGTIGPNRFGPDIDQGLENQVGEELRQWQNQVSANENSSDRRECPECAELIKVNAKKCRFCGAQTGFLSSNSLDQADLSIKVEDAAASRHSEEPISRWDGLGEVENIKNSINQGTKNFHNHDKIDRGAWTIFIAGAAVVITVFIIAFLWAAPLPS